MIMTVDSSDAIDDLSHILQLFKHKTAYIQKLLYSYVHQFFDEASTNEAKQYLVVLFSEEQSVAEKYAEIKSISIKMVMYRFFTRIIEVIQHDRDRIRGRLYASLNEYYNELENLIYSIVSVADGDYPKALSVMYEKSQQYAFFLIERLDEENSKYLVKPRATPVIIQIPPPPPPKQNPQVIQPKKTPKAKPTLIQPIEQPKLNPIMEGLRVLDCLGLDTGIFRSTYLYCKHHDKIIYDECIDRNYVMSNTIIEYRKEYYDWQMGKNPRNAYQLWKERDESSPLRMAPQTAGSSRKPHFRLYDRKFTSMHRLDRSLSKQNSTLDRSKTVSGEYRSSKPSLSPKKVLLCCKKLSLRPLQQRKHSSANSPRKRCRVKGTSPKANQSFQILIQGQRIYQQDSRRLDSRYTRACTSNLFC